MIFDCITCILRRLNSVAPVKLEACALFVSGILGKRSSEQQEVLLTLKAQFAKISRQSCQSIVIGGNRKDRGWFVRGRFRLDLPKGDVLKEVKD